MNLFDASALLCFLENETGAAVVERELLAGGACSAANWSETAQKLLAHGKDWTLARGLLLSYDLVIEPVSADDAERAAHLWRQGSGMSLADRIAVATAHRLGATAWTADKLWGTDPPVRQVR
jgi:ribonuclease VapC